MLDAAVYRRLYQEVRRLPDLDIVEIGAANGTASIAIAWAMQRKAGQGRLVVVEKCEGGSRDGEGDYAANLSILERNWQRFGVRSMMRLFPHAVTPKTTDRVLELIATRQIAGFIHDADGRIDRDFFAFWPLLVDGGLVLVDDVEDQFQESTLADGTRQVLGKRVLTWRLLRQFQAWGLFEPSWEHHGTIVGRKPPGADFSRFDLEWCKATVRAVRAECEQRAGAALDAQASAP